MTENDVPPTPSQVFGRLGYTPISGQRMGEAGQYQDKGGKSLYMNQESIDIINQKRERFLQRRLE
ncbi:MAG: hypothetical protein ISS48_03970 [Candidatus Aenigmarchaeota archaeon]|nr:hypothetical protein [Candidatus Aenigmarchaeota archaeon]